MAVPLQVSQGNTTTAETAQRAAEDLNVLVGDADRTHKYSTGHILADLVVPARGIQLQPTERIYMPLAQHLAARMPFAIAFHVSRWYSPCVPFASSSL